MPDPLFDVRPERATDVVILHLSGELDMVSEMALVSVARAVLEEGPPTNLHLDLGKLTFLDSSGVRALMLVRQELQARGLAMTMDGAQEHVRHVLEIAGLTAALGLLD